MKPRLLCALAVVALLAVAGPACALVYDTGTGSNARPPVAEPTRQQLNQQMKGPKVQPPVRGGPARTIPDPPSLPSGDPQAVLAVTTGLKQAGAPKGETNPQGRSRTLLSMAITCAILGLVAFAGVLACRKGQQVPSSEEHWQSDLSDDEVEYDI